jgi:hypothetical protein
MTRKQAARAGGLVLYVRLSVWESSYPARLRSAIKHNDQVSGSFGEKGGDGTF